MLFYVFVAFVGLNNNTILAMQNIEFGLVSSDRYPDPAENARIEAIPWISDRRTPTQELLKQFYSAITEPVLCTSITVWFSSATKSDQRRLRKVVRTAERIIGSTLPTLQELYLSRVRKRAVIITLDPSHPAHSLFELLPSGRRYRALSTRTTRHRNSFFPQAIISWTLDNKRRTHNTIIQLFIHHTYIFTFQICTYHTCTYIIVYYILCFCFFVHCLFCIFVYYYFYYLCLVLLLSFFCTVELLSL